VSASENDVSAGRMTSSEREQLNKSTVTSVWTTLDAAELQSEQLVQQLGCQGRQSLASVGNESSFFAKDAVCDEHLCSTPSTDDDIDGKLARPPPCSPTAVDYRSVSPPVMRDDRGQRSPPVTSALSLRRSGCVQMPQLTPIREADDEKDDINDDYDDDGGDKDGGDGEVFGVSPRHTARSDVLDLTFVSPVTSLEMTPLSIEPGSSSSSEVMGSRVRPRDRVPVRLSSEQSGTGIRDRTVMDTGDELGRRESKHESSYCGVYRNYVYANDFSPDDDDQRDWNTVDRSLRAQRAVAVLQVDPPVRRLTYQESFVNRTPIDIDTMMSETDAVYRRRHGYHNQQQLQPPSELSPLGCHRAKSPVDDTAGRRLRHRLSVYNENLI